MKRDKSQIFVSQDEFEHLISTPWYNAIKSEFEQEYWKDIMIVLNSCSYLPKKQDLFNALNKCEPDKVKVVILGQDPYIHSNEAHGFSFSVPKGTNIPPSLRNIFNELAREYNKNTLPISGCLMDWEEEGVLLLNSILTVEEGISRSHKNIGWERFTSAIIRYIDNHNKCVFMAWGKDAQVICSKEVVNNKILCAGHPSPLNTTKPFVGCNCFKECNELLKSYDRLPVRWLRIWD